MSPRKESVEKPNTSDPERARRKENSTNRSSRPKENRGPRAPVVSDRVIFGVGDIGSVIDILRGDDSEDAQAFMEVYLSIPEKHRLSFSLEEIFTAAGLTSRDFVECVCGAMHQKAQDISRLMIAVATPKVSAALIRAATEPTVIQNRKGEIVGEGPPDMRAIELFGKMSGMLPIPKGAQTIINMQQLNQTVEDNPVLEPMDDFLMELQSVTKNQLPAPVKTIEVPRNAKDIEYKFSEL